MTQAGRPFQLGHGGVVEKSGQGPRAPRLPRHSTIRVNQPLRPGSGFLRAPAHIATDGAPAGISAETRQRARSHSEQVVGPSRWLCHAHRGVHGRAGAVRSVGGGFTPATTALQGRWPCPGPPSLSACLRPCAAHLFSGVERLCLAARVTPTATATCANAHRIFGGTSMVLVSRPSGASPGRAGAVHNRR